GHRNLPLASLEGRQGCGGKGRKLRQGPGRVRRVLGPGVGVQERGSEGMSEESKQLVKRFVELATSDPDAVGEVVADSYIQPSPTVGPGLDGVRTAFKNLLAAFPDLHIDAEVVVAEGDMVMARLHFHGTHKGPFAGAQPTGNQVDFETAD